MRSYRLWIVEDNDVQLEYAASLVESSSYAAQLSVTLLDSAARLKEELANNEAPDILLADIDLGEEAPTGVDLSGTFFSSKKTQTIYMTGFLNLVTSAYKTDHVYLLAKPVKPQELELALGKAIEALEQAARETLSFTFGSGIKKLVTSQIMWLESSGHRVEIHALDGVRETYDSLRNLTERLPQSFIKTHKSYIANLAHATELVQSELVMSDGSRIPVSRKYRHEVHDALMTYLGLQA